jgi:broad specificity phosphatase PhoE
VRIILVRHAQSWGDVEHIGHANLSIGLTKSGREQAVRTANYIAVHEKDIAAVYTSPLERAKETAQIIATACRTDLDLIKVPEFTEAILGEWEGKSMKEITRDYKKEVECFFMNPEAFQFPGGETVSAFIRRISDGLDRIFSDNKGGTICIVTHWVVIAFIICKLLKRPLDQFVHFESPNSGITVLEGKSAKSLRLASEFGEVVAIDVERHRQIDDKFFRTSFPIAFGILFFIATRIWPFSFTDVRTVALFASLFHWSRYWVNYGYKFSDDLPAISKQHQLINITIMVLGCISIISSLQPKFLFLIWALLYYFARRKYRITLKEASRFASADSLKWVQNRLNKTPVKIVTNLVFLSLAILIGDEEVYSSVTVLLILLYVNSIYGVYGIWRDVRNIFVKE